MDAKEEIRVYQHSLERELNAAVEASAILAALIEKLEQGIDIGFGNRATIGETGDSGEDGRGAGFFFRCRFGRLTNENGFAAGTLGAWGFRGEGGIVGS